MKLTQNQLKQTAIFGVAGNFADHLTQAGEDADFVNIQTADENAPKGIFPVYLPKATDYLGDYPVSDREIRIFDAEGLNLQAEAEMGVLFQVEYDQQKVIALKPIAFTALNDCSIRKPNARKISEKKNWGPASCGIAQDWIECEKLIQKTEIDAFHIVAYLKRNNEWHAYGQDSPVKNYQFFYQQLNDWMIETFNSQTDVGPLENLQQHLVNNDLPQQVIIALGATRYTPFGETHYLQKEDDVCICLYSEKAYSETQVYQKILKGETHDKDFIALYQSVKYP